MHRTLECLSQASILEETPVPLALGSLVLQTLQVTLDSNSQTIERCRGLMLTRFTAASFCSIPVGTTVSSLNVGPDRRLYPSFAESSSM